MLPLLLVLLQDAPVHAYPASSSELFLYFDQQLVDIQELSAACFARVSDGLSPTQLTVKNNSLKLSFDGKIDSANKLRYAAPAGDKSKLQFENSSYCADFQIPMKHSRVNNAQEQSAYSMLVQAYQNKGIRLTDNADLQILSKIYADATKDLQTASDIFLSQMGVKVADQAMV